MDGIDPALRNAIVSYGMNEWISNGAAFGNGPVNLAALRFPSKTLLVADCYYPLTGGGLFIPSGPDDSLGYLLLSRVAFPNIPSDCFTNTARCGALQLELGLHPDYFRGSRFDDQARHFGGDVVGRADGSAKWHNYKMIQLNYLTGDYPY